MINLKYRDYDLKSHSISATYINSYKCTLVSKIVLSILNLNYYLGLFLWLIKKYVTFLHHTKEIFALHEFGTKNVFASKMVKKKVSVIWPCLTFLAGPFSLCCIL